MIRHLFMMMMIALSPALLVAGVANDARAIPETLAVPGFNDAMFVRPTDTTSTAKPVVVVLHGNFDRPEWECEWWRDVAAVHSWVLCPRGVRTQFATAAEDRWTYNSASGASRELNAALDALEKAHPGQVSRSRTVLAGFSLGANMGPRVVELNPGRFSALFLVEGGVEKLNRDRIRTLKRDGIRAIGMAMSAPGRRKMAQDLLGVIRGEGLRAEFVNMRGAGHGYRADFPETGRVALERLLAVDETAVSIPGKP